MSKLKEIHDYLVSVGENEEELRNIYDIVPRLLSEEIARYAHRNQKRENGEEYVNHPLRCSYYLDYPKSFYEEYGMNEEEVETLCKLHDVVEDSELTLEDLRDIFVECRLGEFFEYSIQKQLDALTHRKDEEYDAYIERCMEYPSSALVKYLDLHDNLNVFTLVSFDEDKYNRCLKYIKYLYRINSKYKFIETSNKFMRYKEIENKESIYKEI